MVQVILVVGGSIDLVMIFVVIDGYFDVVSGGGGFIDNGYQGSQIGSNFVLVDIDCKLGIDINVGLDQLCDVLKGFVIIFYVFQNKGLGVMILCEFIWVVGMILVNSENQLMLVVLVIGVQ